MSNRIKDELKNKAFEASIGEPWDFRSKAGQNKLIGIIKAISETDSSVDWMLLEVSLFQHEGNKIKQVVGVNRYKSSQDLFAALLAGNPVTLNFMFALDGHELKEGAVLNELADESRFGFLVGSLKLSGGR